MLRALGVEEDLAHTSIRFGLGRFTTQEEVQRAIDITVDQVMCWRRPSRSVHVHRIISHARMEALDLGYVSVTIDCAFCDRNVQPEGPGQFQNCWLKVSYMEECGMVGNIFTRTSTTFILHIWRDMMDVFTQILLLMFACVKTFDAGDASAGDEPFMGNGSGGRRPQQDPMVPALSEELKNLPSCHDKQFHGHVNSRP